MKVHLIDGTYELFRNFYAVPSRRSQDGQELGAVGGLLRTLLALLDDPQVTHAAVAFDHVIESFRNALFAGYKTGEGVDPDLLAQFDPAEDACRALGLVTWPMVELEADDAIATAAHRFAAAKDVEQIVICSPDKDLAQCVRSERVVCLDRMRARVLDERGVIARYGVAPGSIPDWLALVGDTADGIPGIAGWGPKSASALLGAYRRIEQIPTDPRNWVVAVRGAARLAANLRERYDDALLYRQLATLRTDAPLEQTLNGLRWSGPDAPALRALAAELGDDGIAVRAETVAAGKHVPTATRASASSRS